MIESTFDGAFRELSGSTADELDLSAPFTRLFPVDGVAVSTLGSFLGSETLSASDARAALLDELQLDLGEGPCWDAMTSGHPVLAPDLAARFDRWPIFIDAISPHGVASIFAFPLRLGPLHIGAIDLYCYEKTVLGTDESARASRLAEQVSRRILRQALASVGEDDVRSRPFSRRLVHQATGMIVSQLDVSADDAELVIQGHAFSEGMTMMEVAQLVVDRELVFTEPEQSDPEQNGEDEQ